MSISKIGVVGAGQMGSGIGQVAATVGLDVVFYDNPQALERATSGIEKSLSKFVEKEKISDADKSDAISRISYSKNLDALKDVDLVVEAIVEDLNVKTELFEQLDRLVKPEAILVSNTSSISITKLAAATKRPDKVAGMHFMNPVPLMKLVEGIRGIQTSDETWGSVRALSEKMGKTFVESVKDSPGFIVNRILMPMINEAVFTLHEGIASVEDIDQSMKLGTNQPMGPLTLADFIGLDTCLAIMNVLHEGLGDSKYRPCPLLRTYVDAGWVGRKSGRGFYNYEG